MPIFTRDNLYNFDGFLSWRSKVDYYKDDPFIQKTLRHFSGANWKHVDEAARKLSSKASFHWRDLADEAAKPKNHPIFFISA